MRLRVNDTELYFDVDGASLVPDGSTMRERPTILFLHGGPGFDHTCFKPFLSSLADVAQLVYVDLRGQGRSGRPDVETCTPAKMADDVAALCRMLEIERPVVFGHSFGGFVALHLAVNHPDLASRLILSNTSAGIGEMSGGMDMLERQRGPQARLAAERMFGGDFGDEAMAAFQELVWPAYVTDPVHVPLVNEIATRSIVNFAIAEYYFGHVHPSYNLGPQLCDIKAPTLVITGEDDWVVHPKASRALAREIPDAELLVVPETTHFGFVERPDVVLPAICSFINASTHVTATV